MVVVLESACDLGELAAVTAEVKALEERRDGLVGAARQAGVSWRQIGTVLGVSGQAAHKRYRHVRFDPVSGRVWHERPLPGT